MFDYLRFRWKLWGTERQRRAAGKVYEKDLAAAKARKASAEEIEEVSSRGMTDDYELDDEVVQLHTAYLLAEARRLMLAAPEIRDEERWGCGIVTGRRQLTKKGIVEMRAAIRAEKKASREGLLLWVPGITGILGLVVALAAIVLGRK
ncbi:hypothetical protein JQ621_25300 [Bradyrhizobium manausense]|uniref:hypothetical protein n=1 Tax=Bradyrhizobium manausense TaxID=989370 RepID=UPI001BAB4661|nr:hypothetical protein [Bradyrhizobium manausense]MBR1090792.1 hypothetical protein [Bradyrhizobium manausense]